MKSKRLKKGSRAKPLNLKGIAVVLVIAIIVSIGVGMFGTSHAASSESSYNTCEAKGYTYVGGKPEGSIAVVRLYKKDIDSYCIDNKHTPSYWGVQMYTEAMVSWSRKGGGDSGNFYYYAGPVEYGGDLYGGDRCSSISGKVIYNGVTYQNSFTWPAGCHI